MLPLGLRGGQINPLGWQRPRGGFSPLDVPGLRYWLDFRDTSTLFQDAARTVPVLADGDVLGGVVDKSQDANTAYQTVTAKKMIWTDGGAKNDGVDDYLVTDLARNITSSNFLVITVAKMWEYYWNVGFLTLLGAGAVNDYDNNFTHVTGYRDNVSATGKLIDYRNGFLSQTAAGVPALNQKFIHLSKTNGVSNSVELNNVAYANVPITGSLNANKINLNIRYYGGVYHQNMVAKLISYEYLVYDVLPSNENIDKLKNYLNEKWGVY